MDRSRLIALIAQLKRDAEDHKINLEVWKYYPRIKQIRKKCS